MPLPCMTPGIEVNPRGFEPGAPMGWWLQAQGALLWAPRGASVQRGAGGPYSLPLLEFLCCRNQLNHSCQRVLMVFPFRNNLFAFRKAQKALIFKAFLGKGITILLCFLPSSGQSPSHKNKQTYWQAAGSQHLVKLDQFAKWRWLFS